MPQIVAMDKVNECKPLIDWLRIAVSLHRSANNRNLLPVTMPALATPMMDLELHAFRERIVNQDLPGRTNQLLGVQDSILQLAAVVTDNTTKPFPLSRKKRPRHRPSSGRKPCQH